MTQSEEYYQKVIKRIPWGTQTNAKRPILTYSDVMPFYIEKAKGCRFTDIDGREFIDYQMALGPVILGYCYDEIDNYVIEQMKRGVLFSMASPIEYILANLISEFVPTAEMVRFMKTGEEANSACIRLARAYTGRDMIATCGYHGYPDWFMTHIPNNGIPKFMNDYVKQINWGDLESAQNIINKYGEQLACVIVVGYDFNDNTSPEFLQTVRELTKKNGIVLILDEVLTGFRLSKNGAAEYFGISPDLSTYAKAMANGYPISAFTGKKEIMSKLDDIIITTTYAGETLSIAAAIATLSIMNSQPIHSHIWKYGKKLMDGFNSICKELDVQGYASSLPPASYLKFNYEDPSFNEKLDYLFHYELFKNGIFVNARWFISYSHKDKELEETLDKIRISLKEALNKSVNK